jgi:hypothetical protein
MVVEIVTILSQNGASGEGEITHVIIEPTIDILMLGVSSGKPRRTPRLDGIKGNHTIIGWRSRAEMFTFESKAGWTNGMVRAEGYAKTEANEIDEMNLRYPS